MISINGIIIRTFASKESDLVVRIISTEMGKISALAKYARKSKRRFPGGLDILDCGAFELVKGKGDLAILTSFTPNSAFRRLRDTLTRLTVASALCECADLLFHEDSEEQGEPFKVLHAALISLSDSSAREEALAIWRNGVTELLKISGYTLPSANLATSKALRPLIALIEHAAEREFLSKNSLLELESIGYAEAN